MDTKLLRLYLIELIGVFGLVLFSAGLICINQTALPETSEASTSPLMLHQPGLLGLALGQGLILAAMLALTAPVTGGYLNPAITLMLWVMGKIETPRATGLIVAQFLGGILGAVALRYLFAASILQAAHFGAPHMNPLAYRPVAQPTIITGVSIELILTFFLVFAIFGLAGTDALRLGLVTGMIATVCVLFAFPLTGAALNPARWLGPTLLESFTAAEGVRSPWADSLVYLAGPILGSLLGGVFVFKVYQTPAPK